MSKGFTRSKSFTTGCYTRSLRSVSSVRHNVSKPSVASLMASEADRKLAIMSVALLIANVCAVSLFYSL